MKLLEPGWLRAQIFTVLIVLLIVIATGGDDFLFQAFMLATIFGGVGLVFVIFPGSHFFAIALANCLALYACAFVFLVENNFADASNFAVNIGVALPVVTFLAGAFWRRQAIQLMLMERQSQPVRELGSGFYWLIPIAMLGALTFVIPRAGLTPQQVDLVLLTMMAAIALLVLIVSENVCTFLLDTGLLFEEFFSRIRGLVIPTFAFLTFYSLLIILFACVYRIIDLYSKEQQFAFGGEAYNITFSDCLYFSLVTLSTLGYGDVSPIGPLVRVVVGLQIIAGVLLLLFGFSELMRYTHSKDDD